MQRRHPEYPLTCSCLDSGIFEVEPLNKYRETFHEENTAQNRQKQFLSDKNGTDSDDSSDGQTAGVTHKYLSRIGVVPQESEQCSDKRRHEYGYFSGTWYIHDVQVVGVYEVTA